MYKSPIEVFYGEMKSQFDGDVLKAVQDYGIYVDKNELIKALTYDRNQYDKGYEDGKREALESIVRCKDCAVPHNKWLGCPNLNGLIPPPDFYCAKGERKGEGE